MKIREIIDNLLTNLYYNPIILPVVEYCVKAGYTDVPGFCKAVTLDEIRAKDYVLTPGRYIGLPEDEDDFDFAERFGKLKAELDEQMREETRLNALIRENLAKLEIGENVHGK